MLEGESLERFAYDFGVIRKLNESEDALRARLRQKLSAPRGFTFEVVSDILRFLPGGPRCVIQDMEFGKYGITIYCHRKHISRIRCFDWSGVKPAGMVIEFKAKSHAWLKLNSQGRITAWMAGVILQDRLIVDDPVGQDDMLDAIKYATWMQPKMVHRPPGTILFTPESV